MPAEAAIILIVFWIYWTCFLAGVCCMTGLELWRAYRECSPRAPRDAESARVSPEPPIVT